MKITPLTSSLALAAMAALPLAASADVNEFFSDLQPLNGAFDADGVLPSGTARIIVNDDDVADDGMSGTATIRVRMTVTGLEELGNIPGAAHVAHIHGQFAANAGLPAVEQVNGPFFTGEGGDVVQSRVPSLSMDDANGNGYLNFFEGLPAYGPVVLNLGPQAVADNVTPAPDGVPPLVDALNFLADNGLTAADVFPTGDTFDIDTLYSFDLSDQDARRQYNNLTPLTAREIVVHGLTIPSEINAPLDATIEANGLPDGIKGIPVPGDDSETFRTTAPVAAGAIVAVPTPSAVMAGLTLLGGLALRRRRAA